MKKDSFIDSTPIQEYTESGAQLGTYRYCLSQRLTPCPTKWMWYFLVFYIVVIGLLCAKFIHNDTFDFYSILIISSFYGVLFGIVTLFVVMNWYFKKARGYRVFVFDRGFIVQKTTLRNYVKYEDVYAFDEIEGMTMYKENTFYYARRSRRYGGTLIELQLKLKNMDRVVALKGTENNIRWKESKYEFFEWASRSVIESWIKYQMPLHEEKIRKEGYTEFELLAYGTSKIGEDGFTIGEQEIPTDAFAYDLKRDTLEIIPVAVKKRTTGVPITLELNGMYNRELFLELMKKYHNIS